MREIKLLFLFSILFLSCRTTEIKTVGVTKLSESDCVDLINVRAKNEEEILFLVSRLTNLQNEVRNLKYVLVCDKFYRLSKREKQVVCNNVNLPGNCDLCEKSH